MIDKTDNSKWRKEQPRSRRINISVEVVWQGRGIIEIMQVCTIYDVLRSSLLDSDFKNMKYFD